MEKIELDIDSQKITAVIEKRLVHAPQEVKDTFPEVLKQTRVSWVTISKDKYLLVSFLTPEEEKRIIAYEKKQLFPFPGLITTGIKNTMFQLENSRNIAVVNCKASNLFTFSLGSDSTIWIENHSQSINTDRADAISYKIPLAYLVSYGGEINRANLYEYFEGLVAFSTNKWREANG